ncbi:MAG: FAD-dependent oxidoreductase [Candidatus Nanopelagicaceae bacterium]|jgi:glycine cleavage system aminomethyltransferase T/glycine/D-amino acid oxidase-like deaminating enzyme
MSTVPGKAKAVVIGAGIVGNSIAYHLARLGWRDIVQIDKGPLPNPGGSTGHASNFIFPVDHSKEMTAITSDSVRQYKELGTFTECGGIEVARTPERMQELQRRVSSGKSWGIENSRIVTPAEVKELVPYIDETVILGGFYTPSVGVVDSLRAGTLMREKAIEMGALQSFANIEVLGMDVEEGRIKRVRTDHGDIEAEYVVIATGCWSPKLAKMAGASIPLTPAVHQMKDIGPVPFFADSRGDIEWPIIRDMDTNMYERQHGTGLEVGSYAHRPILYTPEDIPSNATAALSPTEFPFTQNDFDIQDEHSLELMPSIIGDENVREKYAINGILSLTPDGMPILGETPEVKGLWSAAAVWVKEGPGTGKSVAEWMVLGQSEIDLHSSDIARFHEHQKTTFHVKARTAEGFNKTYGIVHPSEQWESNRNVRLSPFYNQEKALDAVFFETAGWERPFWYNSNSNLLTKFGDQVMPRTSEWESRWWSPIINAEHLQMRESAGVVDLSAFAIFDITGPSALAHVQKMVVRQMDVAVGRVVYTPVLGENGGFKSDLTIMRLAHGHFRVVTGGAHGMADKKWFADHLPSDGSAQITDLTSAFTTIGVWGPKAREILSTITGDDLSKDGFKFSTCRVIETGPLRVLASRISYVGELGWELYVPIEQGAKLWDLIWEAGKAHSMIPVGIGVYGTTGRIEKSYRAYGAELETEYNAAEAGMTTPKIKEQDFIGKTAHLRHRDEAPVTTLCSLTVDDHTSSTGEKRYMLGKEPILTLAGGPIADSHGRRSYVTTAGSAPSLGKHVLMAYLPTHLALMGAKFLVEYLGEHYPVTVAGVGATPLFDPKNERVLA